MQKTNKNWRQKLRERVEEYFGEFADKDMLENIYQFAANERQQALQLGREMARPQYKDRKKDGVARLHRPAEKPAAFRPVGRDLVVEDND